jgi:type III secretion protein J
MFSRRCCVLLLGLITGCRDRIHHGLDERQANELQRVLIERGFDARKVPESGKKPSWALEVDDEQGPDAVRVLAELGLPRPMEAAGCDVFGGGGLVRTPVEEQLCRVRVMEQGLEKTLGTVEGVLFARVHLVVPPPARPGQAASPAKASALLRVAPGEASRLQGSREALRALIAGGVEGLSTEAVSLLVDEVSTRVVPPAPGPTPLTRLRVLLAVLCLLLTGLSAGLGWVTIRSRRKRAREERLGAAAPTPTRPVVAPGSSARKVA